MKKMNSKKGFTLMEMLIVVAIIAVLVAIAIPTMSASLEKAREAADAANIRSAYADLSAKFLEWDSSKGSTTPTVDPVACTQKQAKWQSSDDAETLTIGGQSVSASSLNGWTVTINTTSNKIEIKEKSE